MPSVAVKLYRVLYKGDIKATDLDGIGILNSIPDIDWNYNIYLIVGGLEQGAAAWTGGGVNRRRREPAGRQQK
ncbi:hypothetical protein L1887_30359 [Cichorium endivia]|nr:hypothetical protein L1887_30359 [Cichorium endivia]